ncbi:MAG: SIS domain-containing protein [Anaerococcus hydrogenalis]|nr:SIS domain-containing protein [Anaerococcus hydrogenalis]
MELLTLLNKIKGDENYTQKQKSISQYIIDNHIRICFLSLATICEECGCTEVTFLNFCKKIGFNGFTDLKNTLIKYLEEKAKKISYKTKDYNNSVFEEEFYKNILELEASYLNNLYNSIKVDDIISISKNIISSRYIIIFGHDWSYNMGKFLNERLRSLNLSSILVNLNDFIHTDYIINSIDKNDYPIFFSFPKYFSGSEEIGESLAKKSYNFLLITDSKNSPASKYTDNKIICETHSDIFNNSWVSPLSLVNIISNMIAVILKSKKLKEKSSGN